MIKAVAFDGFSTLFRVPTMSPVRPAWLYLIEFFPNLVEERLAEAHRRYEPDFICGRGSSYSRWARIGIEAGISLQPHQIGKLMVIELKACIENAAPFPGAYETLDRLREAGVVTAVLSNASKVGKMLEEVMEFDQRVDHFVVSCDHGSTKNEPALYQIALNELGLPPGEILYVDDGVEYVRRGKDMGFRTALAIQGEVWGRVDPRGDYGQDVTIYSLPEILQYLAIHT